MNAKLFVFPLALVLFAGCAAPTSNEAPADESAETADDLTAGSDPVVLANAKDFFEKLVNENVHRDDARIPYSKLPAKLAKEVEKNNPNPKQEWAAEAYRTRVQNGKGNLVTIFGVMDGIDDEGESITVYTSTGKEIASGDDYRGFEWNK
jgi:hypothetical protein